MARRFMYNPFCEIRRFKDRKEIHIHTRCNDRHDISFKDATTVALDLLRMVYDSDDLVITKYDDCGIRTEIKLKDMQDEKREVSKVRRKRRVRL